MRELEFLPDWYPRTRHRKRMVVLQTWISLALIGGLGLWLLLVRGNLRDARASLSDLRQEAAQTQQQLRELEKVEQIQKQLGQKDQILASLGPHVEATRMLNKIESVMSPGMSLTELSFDIEEPQPRPLMSLSPAAVAQAERAPNRTLKMQLKGLAPTDVDLAGFLTRLTNVPFFSQVAMTYAKEKIEAAHVMREFQVTFAVDVSGDGRADGPAMQRGQAAASAAGSDRPPAPRSEVN